MLTRVWDQLGPPSLGVNRRKIFLICCIYLSYLVQVSTLPLIFVRLIGILVGCLVCWAHEFLKVEDFHFGSLSSLGIVRLVVG